jgi:hypothetical protein
MQYHILFTYIFRIEDMTARYNIYAFKWVKQDNTFYCEDPVAGVHPIDRNQFYIVNDDTGGFRRFRYTKIVGYNKQGSDSVVYNEFESEDGITCLIKIVE